ncbi:MAG: sigma-70 family RNA polymerase sigma factor [Candidatus Sumerlaeia bacterium]|nr:sigma-70 family RNA polymerase sigma factor [Candidatus Sumerlaeia bacterium]
MALSDVPADLVERCRQGEASAFDELFTMIHDDLFRWSFSLVRDEEDAQEIMQDCFVRIFRHINRLQDPKKFAQWASRLLVNQTNTFRVKKRKNQTEELEEGYDVKDEALPLAARGNPNPRTAAAQKEILDHVNTAIRELPPRQRTAVMLFDVKNQSIKQIAEQLGTSEGAVKFNIFQGRRKLRLLLEKYIDEDGNLSIPD